jgi:hypothetical protein
MLANELMIAIPTAAVAPLNGTVGLSALKPGSYSRIVQRRFAQMQKCLSGSTVCDQSGTKDHSCRESP